MKFLFASRRRHTRCYRDWSSDVCSSDLDAGNRVAEIQRALDEGRDLRMPRHLRLPARRGLRPAVLAPSSAALTAGLATALEREEAYSRALRRLYRYHLVTRNCVSEIFRELDVALLGARVGTDGSRSFIPAL